MRVGALKNILNECRDDASIIIFAETEDKKYRPFKNITYKIRDKDTISERLQFDISIHTEYRSVHFPKNPSENEIMDLKEKKKMLLEELDEINEQLKGFKEK